MRNRVAVVLAAVSGLVAPIAVAAAAAPAQAQCTTECLPEKVKATRDWLRDATTCYAQGEFCLPDWD